MAKVMMQVRSKKTLTLSEIKRLYALAEDEIDSNFGIVEVDPKDHLFAFLVEESAALKCFSTDDFEISGPYSNVRIEPFGPPE